jgi:hypothetical protein
MNDYGFTRSNKSTGSIKHDLLEAMPIDTLFKVAPDLGWNLLYHFGSYQKGLQNTLEL